MFFILSLEKCEMISLCVFSRPELYARFTASGNKFILAYTFRLQSKSSLHLPAVRFSLHNRNGDFYRAWIDSFCLTLYSIFVCVGVTMQHERIHEEILNCLFFFACENVLRMSSHTVRFSARWLSKTEMTPGLSMSSEKFKWEKEKLFGGKTSCLALHRSSRGCWEVVFSARMLKLPWNLQD